MTFGIALGIAFGDPVRRRNRKGGMPPANTLFRQVPDECVRGRLLRWHIRAPRPIPDTMRHFSMTRQNLIAHWRALRLEHGIGYVVEGNRIECIPPRHWRGKNTEDIFGGMD